MANVSGALSGAASGATIGSIGGPVGAAAGGIIGGILGLFGGEEDTPKYNYAEAKKNLANYMGKSFDLYKDFDTQVVAEKVDATKAGNQALNWNAKNMGNFQNMASSMNQGAVQDRLKMLKEISPQWENQRNIADKSNMAMMKGEVPLDVQQAMARSNAYKSFQSGTSGSASAREGTLARDLGITSLGLVQRGQENAQNWLKTNQEIAMPDQVGAGDIMKNLGFDARFSSGVMEGNANRELTADTTSKTYEWNKMQGIQDIYGTELETQNALLSQQLTDAWGKFQGQQAQQNNLMSSVAGLGKSLLTPYQTGPTSSGSGNLWESILSGASKIGGLFN